MKLPRYTGHQLQMLFRIRSFEQGEDERGSFIGKACPKSWFNERGVRVWQFKTSRHPGLTNVLGDPWDCQTGESMLKKGLIEPWFSIIHDGGYNAPIDHYHYADGKEIQFYRITKLGLACLELRS